MAIVGFALKTRVTWHCLTSFDLELTQGQNQSGSGGPGGDKKGDKVMENKKGLNCIHFNSFT